MSKFARQVQRASQRQELDLVKHTVQALKAENTQLQIENKALIQAIGAIVAVSGGEVRVPRDMSNLLKNKNLVSEVEGEDIVFRVVDAVAENKEDNQ